MPLISTLSAERVEDTSNDESSASEDEATSKGQLSAAKHGVNSKSSGLDNLPSKKSSDGSDDSSDESDVSTSNSSSSISTSKKRKAPQALNRPTDSPNKKAKIDLTKVKRVESIPYTPPPGYKQNKAQTATTSSQAQNLLQDLEGKQICHISAPSSFPISKFESLDIEATLKGKFVIHHKGVDYKVSVEDQNGVALLMPKPNGDYTFAAPVTRVLRVTEMANQGLPSSTSATTRDTAAAQPVLSEAGNSSKFSGSNAFFATQLGKKKEPRKQPENLKARYVPFGVTCVPGEEATADIDVTMTDVLDEKMRAVHDLTQETPKSPRKSTSKSASTPSVDMEASPVKRKKERKSKESSSQAETGSADSSQKKKKKKEKSVK